MWWCPFMSASVVGTFKKLVGSLKFCGIAMEFSRTKSGGRCSFHFTSSEVFHPVPHLSQEAFDHGAFGGLQCRFQLLELSKRRFVRRKSQELEWHFLERKVAGVVGVISLVGAL
jgi:hypothetical protein